MIMLIKIRLPLLVCGTGVVPSQVVITFCVVEFLVQSRMNRNNDKGEMEQENRIRNRSRFTDPMWLKRNYACERVNGSKPGLWLYKCSLPFPSTWKRCSTFKNCKITDAFRVLYVQMSASWKPLTSFHVELRVVEVSTFEPENDCCFVEGLRLGKGRSSKDWPGNKCWYCPAIQWASFMHIVHCVRATRGLWSLGSVYTDGNDTVSISRRFVLLICCAFKAFLLFFWFHFLHFDSKKQFPPNFAHESTLPYCKSKRSHLSFANIFLSQI